MPPQLENGKWNPTSTAGDTGVFGYLTADGSPGPNGQKGFKAEKGRYALYVCHGCPFAQRATIIRVLKGLEDFIPVYATDPTVPYDSGFTFDTKYKGTTGDPVLNAKALSELYTATDPNYTGRSSVPVLFDTKDKVIVSNDSSDIIKMLNSAFDGLGAKSLDLYPEDQRETIDKVDGLIGRLSSWWKASFAKDQKEYDEAADTFYKALDEVDSILAKQQNIAGDSITLADIKLFVILTRLDLGVLQKSKLIYKRFEDYENASAYEERLRGVLRSTHFPSHIMALMFCDRGPDKNNIIPTAPAAHYH